MKKKTKRKLPPHIVLPDGRWRFVKKGKMGVKRRKKRGVYKVARRRKSYRRYARSAVGGLKGGIPAAAGGAGDVIIRKFLPINGVGSIAAGMFLKDGVTMKIGFNKAGESIGSMFFGGTGSGNGWL